MMTEIDLGNPITGNHKEEEKAALNAYQILIVFGKQNRKNDY